jgi:hypothetical protein
LQQEDDSQKLTPTDAKNFRSVIGLLLYLSRDRVDIMFGVKELASAMSSPSLCSVQRLRKLIGFIKYTCDIGVKLPFPEHGVGKFKQGTEAFLLSRDLHRCGLELKQSTQEKHQLLNPLCEWMLCLRFKSLTESDFIVVGREGTA